MSSDRREQTPPGGGETDHEAMRAAAMRPMGGPDHVPLAAGGGLELPGREAHAAEVLAAEPVHEPIPGERDRGTLTWREPGAMGGRFSGADTPPTDPSVTMDERTRHDRAMEGGDKD